MRPARFCFLPLLVMLSSVSAWAQRPRDPEGGGEVRGRESAPAEPRYRPESRPTPSSEAPRSESSPSPSAPAAPMPSTGGGVSVQPSAPTYYPRYYYGAFYDYGYFDCDRFFYSLARLYPFVRPGYYTWRYSLLDSPLTAEIVSLAVQDSGEAAESMVDYVDELTALLDQFEAGKVDRPAFRTELENNLSVVRKLAKRIRNDYRLQYVDQRKGIDEAAPLIAGSLAELRGLLDELRRQAEQMHANLERFVEKDMSRVVELDHLRQPSFRSAASNIDKLAKVIQRSAERL